MREVTVPQSEYVNIKIPKSYIDRKIEILLFPIDEVNPNTGLREAQSGLQKITERVF